MDIAVVSTMTTKYLKTSVTVGIPCAIFCVYIRIHGKTIICCRQKKKKKKKEFSNGQFLIRG